MKINKKIRFEEAASWTGSSIISGDPKGWIENISTDSRTIKKGDFFVPISGENFNGHDFIQDALKAGAGGFIYERSSKKEISKTLNNPENNILVLEADNNMDFLKSLAAKYLRQFKITVIGITGSVGKTTTKNLIAGILSIGNNIVFTPKNFNTEIGVAKAIFNIGSDTRYFIAELGMRGKNQIGPLAQLSNVSIGAITAIGESHMEFFNNIEEIASAKAEIAAAIKSNKGKLFLNTDDSMTPFIMDGVDADIIGFGIKKGSEYSFIEKGHDKLGRFSFDFYRSNKKIAHIKMGLPGYHNLYNGCLSAAICHYLGIDSDMIKKGIGNVKMEEHRMNLIKCKDVTILDDCYNASPVSVKSAIDTLLLISDKNKRTVAILADMFELGEGSAKLHHEIGVRCAKKDIDVLIASGKLAKNIYMGFKEEMNKSDKGICFHFNDINDLKASIMDIIKPGDIILVKGSRANKMEDIISFFQISSGEEAAE